MKKLLLAVLFLGIFFILGCAQTAQYDAKADFGQEFKLKMGQTASIHAEKISSKSVKITFLNVTQDSRCPADVQCIWRGAATISVAVSEDSKSLGEFEVSDFDQLGYNSTVKAGKYYITLLNIEPLPDTTKEIKLSDYVATMVVKV